MNTRSISIPAGGRWKGWPLFIGLLALIAIAFTIWQVATPREVEYRDAPEAQRILDIQASMPFQILIPAFLPEKFERETVRIDSSQLGPSGEPMIELTYTTKDGQNLFIRQWVPVNPEKEILAASRPVETAWGQGWLLRQGAGLIALWTDVGPMRVATFANNQQVVSQEEVLQIASTMGPASDAQVFDFVLEYPEVVAVQPPPPQQIPINEAGVQEFTLVVTPGGYDPVRFQVVKDVPVKMTFRQMGRVGCGNELNFPTSSTNKLSALLEDMSDSEVLEFTPTETGIFEFHCSHVMYRGLMTVVE
jgi:hypothetical protein